MNIEVKFTLHEFNRVEKRGEDVVEMFNRMVKEAGEGKFEDMLAVQCSFYTEKEQQHLLDVLLGYRQIVTANDEDMRNLLDADILKSKKVIEHDFVLCSDDELNKDDVVNAVNEHCKPLDIQLSHVQSLKGDSVKYWFKDSIVFSCENDFKIIKEFHALRMEVIDLNLSKQLTDKVKNIKQKREEAKNVSEQGYSGNDTWGSW